MSKPHFPGKSGREARTQDLERKLEHLTGSKHTSVDERSDDFDKFTDMVINFCTKPKHRSKKKRILDFARESCGYVGLKNFYRLAEFFMDEIREDLEIKAAGEYSGFRKVMKEVRMYLGKAIPEDAIVYLVSYEKENGKMKKLNDVFLNTISHANGRCRDMHESDFPMEGGVMHVFVKEKDAEYAVSIEVGIEKREDFFDGRMHTFDYYVAVVRPLFNIGYPKKFRNVVASRQHNQQL